MYYRISEITQITKGRLISRAGDPVIKDIVTDTRRAISADHAVFFALPGGRRDGHSFLMEAHKKGVRNFLVSREDHQLAQSNVILVRDVMQALQTLAAHHRARFDIPVIGITGSNGKTIVKEWLNQLLDEKYMIVRSPKSYNSQIGVPLSVLQMAPQDTLGIFEAGISQVGEMEKLQKIIQPSVGVFTNIGDAHAGGFLNMRQKINEKLRLFSNVKALIYCKDYGELNESVVAMHQNLRRGSEEAFALFSWSRHTEATLRVTGIYRQENRTEIAALYRGNASAVTIPYIDEASIENAINCWCVMLYLDVAPAVITKKISALQTVAMRLELNEGINNTSLINDSYSADISSLRIALEYLEQQHQHPKRTAILTDFLESGRNEKELYTAVANLLGQHKVNRLIGIGTVISRNQPVFAAKHLDTAFFTSVEEFRANFTHTHFSDETILIKGARTFALEQINGLLEKKTHQTVLEINLNALLHNLRRYQLRLEPATRLMTMVKAFSYGSGSYEIASALEFSKVDYLAVAYADEGVDLRKGGITLPIMVMNPDVSSFDALVTHNLEPEMYSLELIRAFAAYLKREGLGQYPIHIELETGMNRLGFASEDLEHLIPLLETNTFHVKSVFSHLVGSEDPALDRFTAQQAALFRNMSDRIATTIGYSFLRHICNTSGISRHPSLQFDMVRMGIGMYGIDAAMEGELQQVTTLKTAIAQIKTVRAGETVSYGRSGKVMHDSKIATVRLGYADGYPRALGNGKGWMMVRGIRAPTIGNICMDMTMIDVTAVPDISDGDEVIVFGSAPTVMDVAAWAGTIPYELLTGVSQRVKRVYFQE